IPAETPVIPPVAPEVEAARVASPAKVLDLITYSSTDSNSSEDPPAPVTLPFWHSSNSSDSSETSRVSATSAARSSPPLSPTHDLPHAVHQILSAPPDIPRRPDILVFPGQEIPLGRPYRTQPSRVRKMLTARKRVRALPSGRLALRYPPDHSSSDHSSSNNSSSDSLSDSSSGHSLPDSSFSSEDSSFDTPATISARPSRKRRRSPAALVPLATPTPGALSAVRADPLLPRKRIRGYVTASNYDDSTEGSYEAYTEPAIDSDDQVDIDADTAAAETAAALEVDIGIEADVGVEVGIGIKRKDKVKEEAKSGNRGTIEIGVDRVSDIKSAHRDQGRRTLVPSKQGAGMLDKIRVL
ncbi:hypothetical protein Tco_1356711, partial [Tanacetum coccineum]